MEHQLTITMTIKITDDDINDITTAALEGGIDYWCGRMEVIEGRYLSDSIGETISRGGSLRLYDGEEVETYVLTLDKLLKGIRLACRDGYGSTLFMGDWLGTYHIDAEAADVIIQYAVFGELRYRH